MIVPDINLLLHAYNLESPRHERAKAWWESLMRAPRPVGLAWAVPLAFLRIATHPRVVVNPVPVARACELAGSWLAQPQVTILHPGERHASILFGLLGHRGTAGTLTTDAHLAALAIEYQAELHSSDAGFARFPGLRWRNPLLDR